MSQISPPGHSAVPTAPPPLYRGARGAVAAGLSSLALVVLIGGVAAVVFWSMTSSVEVALQIFVRFVWLGAAAGAAAALSRSICNTQSNRLLTLRPAKRELSSAIGFLLGLLLAGYLTENRPSASDPNDKQPAIGQVLDIAGPTAERGRFDLADHRGKIVLVDFWATWCGPCLAELPNVRAAYDKYHGNGLEVVAVSLDFERTALEKFLKAHAEPWPQLFFDKEGQRGFDSPLAKKYQVQAIPYLLVIDRDGKLVARNVRGRQIQVAIAEALGLPLPWSDRLASGGLRLMGWMFYGVVESPVWLLLLCVLGGTVVLILAEVAARRTFHLVLGGRNEQ